MPFAKAFSLIFFGVLPFLPDHNMVGHLLDHLLLVFVIPEESVFGESVYIHILQTWCLYESLNLKVYKSDMKLKVLKVNKLFKRMTIFYVFVFKKPDTNLLCL